MDQMEFVKSKVSQMRQRKEVVSQIREEMKDGSEGSITLNDKYIVDYMGGEVMSFSYLGKCYDLGKEGLKSIFEIQDIILSVELEEVWKICNLANK